MSNALIRDVPAEDLERIRSAATDRGTSLQQYLRETVRAQAAYLRRQETLAGAAQRLHGRPAAPEDARDAALEAVDAAHEERADELSNRNER